MYTLTLVAASLFQLCAALGPSASTPSFESFIQTYAKDYARESSEYDKRRKLYQRNADKVEAFNRQPNRLWTAGINSLSDWTEDELKQLRGWKGVASSTGGHGTVSRHSSHGGGSLNLRQIKKATPLPQQKSWSHLSSLSAVRDQGECGSCWAITAATALEANAEIHLGSTSPDKRRFAAQDFVSCVPNEQHCGGDGGCEGATVELAYNWLMRNGISTEEEVPYTASDGTCSRKGDMIMMHLESKLDPPLSDAELASPGVHLAVSSSMPGLANGVRGWERLPENKYEPLIRALVEHGPVAVSVAASDWSSYSTGIFDGCSKNAVIDHAVTLIGYGKDASLNEKFWHIQNSWGPHWGESGTIRLLRQESEDTEWCGVDHQPELGTGCDGGPKEVKVCGMCGILYDTVVPYFSDNATIASSL